MTCQHDNHPCPECAGFDMYRPTPCIASEMEKKLCLDDHGCKCEDIEAWGAVYWWQQSGYWMDKYIESERANKELRGKGMVGLNKGDRNEG